ncbi:hypothetical protein CLV98_11928 [Dyadobacter jejuensis]|uniref:Tandem-95 repeat protein n=1 Tax=Dyadobacter jejuensis TaxID=1082580 RepID=A0A316A8L2_9BACT|nr:Ig-like domain-containing protein [Dyadobacter jejuensis]PWJ54085.1 hypothetical protein CLV98_11928 [Dyadobacter jejuensis]
MQNFITLLGAHSNFKAQLKIWIMTCALLTVMWGTVQAQVTIPAGSFIIKMNVNTADSQKGLKPYGMIHELTKFYNVPVLWVVREGKTKDAVDYTINGVSYSGGLYVISAEYMTTAVQQAITQWTASANTTNGGNGYKRGFVVGNFIPAAFTFTGAKTLSIHHGPLWTLDNDNGDIAEAFLLNAGIPASGYNWSLPSTLGACNDIFVMPHAEPKWSTHGNLFTWNSTYKGAIWTGCRAGSALSNTYNPSNTSQQMNFLVNKRTTSGTGIVLPVANSTNYAQNSLLLWDDHSDGTTPFTTNAAITSPQTGTYVGPDDWVSQFLGTSDAAHTNGSERVYLPVLGNSWRSQARIITFDPTHSDVPSNSPGTAALMVYGRGLGEDTRGWVMYEAGHNINVNNASGVAAMRAFFNWSFMASQDKTPVVEPLTLSGNATTVFSGSPVALSVSSTSPAGSSLSYSWTAFSVSTLQSVGSFSVNNSASANNTVFTPPTVGSPTDIVIKVTVTDACSRKSMTQSIVTVTNTANILGSIWHDPNGNAVHDVSEKPVSGNNNLNDAGNSEVTGGSVYANLVNSNNVVVNSVRVNQYGNFTFTNVTSNSVYKIILTTTEQTISSILPEASASLPSGWVATGTNFGSTANPANRTNVLSIGTLTGNVTGADFGIEQMPTALNSLAAAITNPGGTIQAPVPASLFAATDPEDAPSGYANNLSGREVVLYPATNGTLYYNGTAVNSALTIPNFDPDKVTIDPVGTSVLNSVETTFEFSVKDNASVTSAKATVTVPFRAVLVAIDDINQTPQDMAVDGNVLTNDVGESLLVTGASQASTIPVNTLTQVSGINSNGTVVNNAGSIILNTNGTYTFTPVSGFSGTINPITYSIANSLGGTDTAILDIVVIPPSSTGNEPPIAQDDNVRTKLNTQFTSNVLSNDSDPDGDPLTVISATVPLGFTVQVSGVDTEGNAVSNAGTIFLGDNGSYVFTPSTGFVGAINPINYVISDGNGGMDNADLNILVMPDETNATYANDDANSAPKSQTMTGNIKTNDLDPEGHQTTITEANSAGINIPIGNVSTSIPGVGQLTILADGNYTFVPEPEYVGTIPVTYTICDNGTPQACDQATLYLTSLDMVIPDLTPIITMEPNQIAGTGQFINRIRILNLNYASGGPTSGEVITVRILKNAKWTFTWDGASVSNSLGSLNNPIWTYSDSGVYHTWTTNEVLLKGSSRYIGFTATLTSGSSIGAAPITVQIRYPSGGEVNDQNNTDVETINYSGL